MAFTFKSFRISIELLKIGSISVIDPKTQNVLVPVPVNARLRLLQSLCYYH